MNYIIISYKVPKNRENQKLRLRFYNIIGYSIHEIKRFTKFIEKHQEEKQKKGGYSHEKH